MKMNRIITLCAVALTLAIGASSLLAQGNGGFGGGQGGNRGNRGGGQGGFGQGGQGGFGQGGQGGFGQGGNFDPAQMQQQMQQRMMDNVRQQLEFTNDTDWDAVAPLVQKVLDARTAVGNNAMRGMMGGGRGGRGGNNAGGRGGQFGQQANPEMEALQKAIEDNAPASQVKDLLAKYKASQQAKETKLAAAQDALKAVLTTRQEAQAYLMGLVR